MSAIVSTRDRALGYLRANWRDRNFLVYATLGVGAVLLPAILQFIEGPSQAGYLIGVAADAGVYVLLALGLNVVVGFAGLLDLGYAAFFAIGAYTYGMLASAQLAGSPIHHAVNLPFWLLLVIAVVVAASFGVVLGAPTLRLRGDYLAIVTLGFGEIVPRVFRNLATFTGGVNGITAISPPQLPFWINFNALPPQLDTGVQGVSVNSLLDYRHWPFAFIDSISYYVLMVLLIVVAVILVNNLYSSRLGRAWMAVREDEVAAAAMGVNTVNVKLMAFAIGASFSGFAGCYYAAKLSLVSPENFSFNVSVTILCMVVLGGMGNIAGVMVGALLMYFVIFIAIPAMPDLANNLGSLFAFDASGIGSEILKMNYLIFGLILVLIMVLRPQGLIPSRVRAQELEKGTSQDSVFDESTA